jgi:hypothetical protein
MVLRLRQRAQKVLERLRLRVIRFANTEACDDLDSVIARIHAAMRLPFD